ncbi:MAG: OmpH family outer membrane protein [Candidatus Aureabacteria bacterium]|nr:OmpH family outer membrane protein [Candidatus Auribacterota bacterium]
MRYILPMLLLGVVISGCAPSPTDIAVIDIDAIFKNYKKSQSIYEGLEKERSSLETKGQEMLDEINKLVKESELLSEETRKERETRIKEKSVALEAYRRGATKDLAERTNSEYQKLMNDVRVAAEAVAQRRHIKIILDTSAVVYGAKGLEVTREVIDELNRRFDKATEKSEARAASPTSPTPR